MQLQVHVASQASAVLPTGLYSARKHNRTVILPETQASHTPEEHATPAAHALSCGGASSCSQV